MAELEKMKYEEALGRLEKIVAQIEDPQTAVGDIPAKVKTVKKPQTNRPQKLLQLQFLPKAY